MGAPNTAWCVGATNPNALTVDELELVVDLEVDDVVILLDKRYPSERVKFRVAESGKFVASEADLTTFHNVHMTSCPVGRFSV